MQIAFLPTSLEKLSPTIGIPEAVHRIIDGTASRDHVLHFNPETFEMAWWHDGKLVSPAEYERLTKGYMDTYQRACATFLRALQAGELKAYIWSHQRSTLFHVPRFYWLNLQNHELADGFKGMEAAAGWDDSMAEQPIVLSQAEFDVWKQWAAQIVKSEKLAPGPAAGGSKDDTSPSCIEPLAGVEPKISASPKWQRQTKETDTHVKLAGFLLNAHRRKMLLGQEDHRSLEWLHERFEKFCADHKSESGEAAPLNPFSLSWFKKWEKRYRSGEWGNRPKDDTGMA